MLFGWGASNNPKIMIFQPLILSHFTHFTSNTFDRRSTRKDGLRTNGDFVRQIVDAARRGQRGGSRGSFGWSQHCRHIEGRLQGTKLSGLRMNAMEIGVVEAGRVGRVVCRGYQCRVNGRRIAMRRYLARGRGVDGRGLHVEWGGISLKQRESEKSQSFEGSLNRRRRSTTRKQRREKRLSSHEGRERRYIGSVREEEE